MEHSKREKTEQKLQLLQAGLAEGNVEKYTKIMRLLLEQSKREKTEQKPQLFEIRLAEGKKEEGANTRTPFLEQSRRSSPSTMTKRRLRRLKSTRMRKLKPTKRVQEERGRGQRKERYNPGQRQEMGRKENEYDGIRDDHKTSKHQSNEGSP